ncbi:hypothetical protein GBAR_LOCUS13739, partial [Geodia barretti]
MMMMMISSALWSCDHCIMSCDHHVTLTSLCFIITSCSKEFLT